MFPLRASPLVSLAAVAALAAPGGCGPGPYALLAATGAFDRSGGSSSRPDSPPTLAVATPASAQEDGIATIAFTVADAEGQPAEVAFEFSVDGDPFRPARPHPTSDPALATNPAVLPADADGETYAFRWDTAAVRNSAEVIVAVTARGGGTGVRAATGRFKVVNRPLALDLSGLDEPEAPGRPRRLPATEAAPAGVAPPGSVRPSYVLDLAGLVPEGAGLPPFIFQATFDPPLPGVGVDRGSGRLAGDPSRSGTYRLTVSVDDFALARREETVELTVLPTLRFPVKALPPGRPGEPYAERVPVLGGTPPYRFAIEGPAPSPFAIEPSTGIVSGTIAGPGLGLVRVRVEDAAGFSTAATLRLRIAVNRPIAETTRVPAVPSGSAPRHYLVADLDGDGLDDVLRVGALTPDEGDPTAVFDAFLARPDGTLGPAAAVTLPPGLPAIPTFSDHVAADFDGDGRDEFATLDVGTGTIHVFHQPGADPLAFEARAVAIAGFPAFGGAVGFEARDLDGDGRADLLVSKQGVRFASGTFLLSRSTFFLLDPTSDGSEVRPGPAAVDLDVGFGNAPGGPTANLDGLGGAEVAFLGTYYTFDPAAGDLVATGVTYADSGAGATERVADLDGVPGEEIVRVAQDPSDGSFALEVLRFDGTSVLAGGSIVPVASLPLGAAVVPPELTIGGVGPAGEVGVAVRFFFGGALHVVLFRQGAFDPPDLGPQAAHVVGGFPLLLLRRGGGHADAVFSSGFSEAEERFLLLRLDPETGRFDGPDAQPPPVNPFQGAFRLLGRDVYTYAPDGDPPTTDGLGALSPDAAGRLLAPRALTASGIEKTVLGVDLVEAQGAPRALIALLAGPVGADEIAVFAPPGGPEPLPLLQRVPVSPAMGAPPSRAPEVALRAADLDGDGVDEAVLVDRSTAFVVRIDLDDAARSGIVAAHFAGFNTSFIDGFEVVDLDRDGRPDLLLPTQGVAIALRGAGGFELAPPTVEHVTDDFGFGVRPRFVAGDLDGDEAPDTLALGVPVLDEGSLALLDVLDLARNRDGRLGPPVRLEDVAVRGEVRGFVLLDANLDGALDAWVIAERELGLELSLLEGRGDGTFARGRTYDFGFDATSPGPPVPVPFVLRAAGDIDADGIDDLVLGVGGGVTTLYGDGRGGFRRADPGPIPPLE